MKKNYFKWIWLNLLAVAGCSSWNNSMLSRTIPVTQSKNVAAHGEPTVNELNPDTETHRKTSQPKDIRSRTPSYQSTSQPNYLRKEFQLSEWPDASHWDKVYERINDADTRQVHRNGEVTKPLAPLPRQMIDDPTDPLDVMFAILGYPAKRESPNPNNSPLRESPGEVDASTQSQDVPEPQSGTANDTDLARAETEAIQSTVPDNGDTESFDPFVEPKIENLPAIGTGISPIADPQVKLATGEEPVQESDLPIQKPLRQASSRNPWTLEMYLPYTKAAKKIDSVVHLAAFSTDEQPISLADQVDRLTKTIARELEDPNLDNARRQALQLSQRLLTHMNSEEQKFTSRGVVGDQSRFWEHQLLAIESMISRRDASHEVAFGQNASATLEHLRRAEIELQNLAGLRIANPNFCFEVLGFGQYKECETPLFKAGQQILLYCELENYTSQTSEQGKAEYNSTRLKNSIAICNDQQQVVQQIEFPVVEDLARSHRRDFYLYMPITIGGLPMGKYKLYLTVTDLHGNKTTTLDPPLSFEVKQ